MNPPIEPVILPDDSRFPEAVFSFEELKEIGLTHLGNLSGNIWTDHNVHDPGITILEMLCYALMDLGYRTRLPIEDLLAPSQPGASPDKNFYTPGQILTQNPVTLLDFRRLLLDIEGVQNAWLIPVEKASDLSCTHSELASSDQEGIVRGLYRIELLLHEGVEKDAVKQKVWDYLQEHRNLCEDFLPEICIAKKIPIAICGELELVGNASISKVYVEILRILYRYLSPSPSFYTLEELLKQGKSIEEIYEGRPYRDNSTGFIDPIELEKLQPLTEVRLSDLIELLQSLPEIEGVSKLTVTNTHNEAVDPNDTWVFPLGEACSPILDLEGSTFTFIKQNKQYTPNHRRALNQLRRQGIYPLRYSLSSSDLDLPIPRGEYRSDLSNYYSIQHEFPQVYGIGPGGPGSFRGIQRRAQSLQLKGYLLFFDRLLADYIMQISQLGEIFSLKAGIDNHPGTYFLNDLGSVPEGELLDIFSVNQTLFSSQLGQVLAFPVRREELENLIEKMAEDSEIPFELKPMQFQTVQARSSALNTLHREFRQQEFSIEIFEEGEKDCLDPNSSNPSKIYRFYLVFPESQMALLDSKGYESEAQAMKVANSMAFLGAFRESFRTTSLGKVYHPAKSSDPESPPREEFAYSFEMVGYLPDRDKVLSTLQESPALYRKRRLAIQDHLLARFAESFSEYATLHFQLQGQSPESENMLISQKASYLCTYDTLGRNRGKAWNYHSDLGYVGTNRPGALQKTEAGMGVSMANGGRLCPFMVEQDESGDWWYTVSEWSSEEPIAILATSRKKFNTADNAWQNTSGSIAQLGQAGQDKEHFCLWETRARYFVSVVGESFQQVIHPAEYASPKERDLMVEWVMEQGLPQNLDSDRLEFCEEAPDNWHFYVFGAQDQLESPYPILIWRSVPSYPSEDAAKDAYQDFHASFPQSFPEDLYELEELKHLQLGDCGPFTFAWTDPSKEIVRSEAILRFDEAVQLKDRLFQVINVERGFLLEHILLRPQNHRYWESQLSFLDNSQNPNCQLLWDDPLVDEEVPVQYTPFVDPYSFWATAFLPGWTARGADRNFRLLTERKLRAEIPAHCALRILWLSPKAYCDLEPLIKEWASQLAELNPGNLVLEDSYYRLVSQLIPFVNLEEDYDGQQARDFIEDTVEEEAEVDVDVSTGEEELPSFAVEGAGHSDDEIDEQGYENQDFDKVPSEEKKEEASEQEIELDLEEVETTEYADFQKFMDSISEAKKIEPKGLSSNLFGLLEGRKIGLMEEMTSLENSPLEGTDLYKEALDFMRGIGSSRSFLPLGRRILDALEEAESPGPELGDLLSVSLRNCLDQLLTEPNHKAFEESLDLLADFLFYNEVPTGQLPTEWYDDQLSQYDQENRVEHILKILQTGNA